MPLQRGIAREDVAEFESIEAERGVNVPGAHHYVIAKKSVVAIHHLSFS